jgi:3-deoxy-D-manno-octulosonate 8-phosphate phosphatase (KDO 8-P phosphatase)
MAPRGVSAEVLRRAKRIRALVLDVDGVLTDGRMVYDDRGGELKCFDVQDGTGLVLWHRAGHHSALITGKRTVLLQRRAKDLGVGFVAQKALDKLTPYQRFVKRAGLSHEEVCAIGDDVLDLPILRRVGLAVAVPNAVPDVKSVTHYLTGRSGGRGAVREVIDLILKAQGAWDRVCQAYLI